jgi:ABC-type dipeptide/oligopeptide/nickel transport system permease component
MLAYAIQRIVLFAATLLIASMIVFAVMNILPGERGPDDAGADRDTGGGRGALA